MTEHRYTFKKGAQIFRVIRLGADAPEVYSSIGMQFTKQAKTQGF